MQTGIVIIIRKSPQIWEARCHDRFADVLGFTHNLDTSYGPDEHASLSVTRKEIEKMTGIFLDIGECGRLVAAIGK
ncbi:hypothetical protein GR217_37520 [Rhizobium leguminosarum]|uniref:Uncharacterized protein n=1 Tax=Rhizobium ruizarguesonis TaxID=2081791 RepID=A0AAE4YYD0_9HYPH|nr:hypothetical protein [Rhizobium ruizarguesonis]NEI53281.1 hypothetical protein [Rhizobium ruizarguesonis]